MDAFMESGQFGSGGTHKDNHEDELYLALEDFELRTPSPRVPGLGVRDDT